MKLILGKMNASCIVNYWKLNIDSSYFKDEDLVGNYAVVENLNDFDLVKIIGVVTTDKKYEKFLTGKNISKNVVRIFGRSMFRND